MEKFMQSRLEELQSQQETRNLIGELSSRITDHRGRVRQLLRSEPLRHPEVVPLVLVGMAADRPLKSNFFPGLLEELLGSLGIASPGEGNPPSSSQEGAGHAWSSAVCEAISQIEQKEVEAPGAVGLPQSLDLHYEEDFLERQRHEIPPIFSDPLFIPQLEVSEMKESAQVPHSPVNRSRSKSARFPTLIRIMLTSLFQRRNCLVEAARSDFPLNS